MAVNQHTRKSSGNLLYDSRARSIFFQVATLLLIGWAFYSIVDNTLTNLSQQNKNTGFAFLEDTSNYGILQSPGTILMDYQPGESTYLDVYWVGIINTLAIALPGIVAATLIGFLMGVARLSSNIVIRGFASIYVEVIRNVPLLLQIFFWYAFVLLELLPDKRSAAYLIPDVIGLNITGLYAPSPVPLENFGRVLQTLLIAIVVVVLIGYLARKLREKTGTRLPMGWLTPILIIGATAAAYIYYGRPLDWEMPEFRTDGPIFKRGFDQEAGMVVKPEYIALFLALVLYTAGFIAEIVRGGILAIPKGQTEASEALGIRRSDTLRLVIIPQALRVIVPPLTSQYLNLTKNSSLAVAIAYPDVVSVFAGTALNTVGQELEMIFMMMLVYLTFSLITALLMNWYNARIKLVER